MKKTLLYHYYLTKIKYFKYKNRLEKALSNGSFHKLLAHQKAKLLSRLERVKQQLARLEKQLQYTAAATVLVSGLALTEAEAQITAVGSEFKVNTHTTNYQWMPDGRKSVAVDANGNFIITWYSVLQDGEQEGIYAQRYNANGVAQGSEFKVNTYTSSTQAFSSVAMDDNGNFVISWSSVGQDGSNWGVFAQRYDANGNAQGSEFQVNTYTTNHQYYSSVAMDTDGDFVIAWTSVGQDGSDNGVYAQRYNTSGVAQGTEFQVNTFTTSVQERPTVVMDAVGNFVIAWSSQGQGSGGIYAQRYNASGVAQGGEFRVNSNTSSGGYCSAAMDANGNFIITWQGVVSSYEIFAQRYNSNGTTQGSEFRVNTHSSANQLAPSVSLDDNGNFVITWSSANQDGSDDGIYAQLYNSIGTAQGAEFKVNTYTTSEQDYSSVAMDNSGDVVVVWSSYGQDGSGEGVYAQRYKISGITGTTDAILNNAIINLYPNPAQNQLSVSTLGLESSNAIISLKDVSGNELRKMEAPLSDQLTNSFDIEGLDAGIYFLHIQTEEGFAVRKLEVY